MYNDRTESLLTKIIPGGRSCLRRPLQAGSCIPSDVMTLHRPQDIGISCLIFSTCAHACWSDACKLSDENGVGSYHLPIIETQEGDVSAYIPTNVISYRRRFICSLSCYRASARQSTSVFPAHPRRWRCGQGYEAGCRYLQSPGPCKLQTEAGILGLDQA